MTNTDKALRENIELANTLFDNFIKDYCSQTGENEDSVRERMLCCAKAMFLTAMGEFDPSSIQAPNLNTKNMN